MKVVIAIDSYKGSVTSLQAGEAAKAGVLAACPGAKVEVLPLADGGEGTVEALTVALGGQLVEVDVTGPMEEREMAVYGFMEETGTAVMEMAQAAGLPMVPVEERNPMKATSFGVGEQIADAVKKGCRHIWMGIGGSATNDGGVGMLQALGWRFLDKEGNEVVKGGQGLADICTIDDSQVLPGVKETIFEIACDVENPLCGPKGASAIYGPQKGATEEMVAQLDAGLSHFADVAEAFLEKSGRNLPGSGAAGGLGFALTAFLGGNLKSGIEMVLDAMDMDAHLQGADVVITGEGRLDGQTAMGKAPVGVAKRAKEAGAVVIAVAGCTEDAAVACNAAGIDAFFAVTDRAMTLQEAMDQKTTEKNIKKTTEQAMRLYLAAKKEK